VEKDSFHLINKMYILKNKNAVMDKGTGGGWQTEPPEDFQKFYLSRLATFIQSIFGSIRAGA
jgi:hypothetical protein